MKILFVNYTCIGDNNATGQTLQSLFDGMQGIEIMQLCLSPSPKKDPLFQTINCSWRDSLLNYFIGKYHSGVTGKSNSAKTTSLSSSRKFKLVFQAKQLILKIQDLLGISLSRKINAEIKKFMPDLVYTLGGSVCVCKLCCRLSKELSIPVVMHSMDDHIHTKYQSGSFLDKTLKKLFVNETREIYKISKIGMAIGPKMAEEYEKEFQIPFSWAMNCIDSTHYQPIKLYQPIRLIFSGGVHGGRDVTLVQLIDYISNYNKNRDVKVYLEVYTNPQGVSLLKEYENEYAKICNYVSKAELFSNLSRATLLLHVESFEPDFQKYFRLSMSTKIPEYLSVGRPILFIGPEDIGTGEYLRKTSVAFSISSIEKCGQVFDSLNPDIIQTMCEQALVLFQRNHTRKEAQEKLRNVFISAINAK